MIATGGVSQPVFPLVPALHRRIPEPTGSNRPPGDRRTCARTRLTAFSGTVRYRQSRHGGDSDNLPAMSQRL